MAGADPRPKGPRSTLILRQEAIAAAYGWPPAVLDDLTLDELELWAPLAEARLKQRLAPTCPFIKRTK